MDDRIEQLKQKAKEYISQNEIVYGVNIHCVGFGLRLKDISLEEITGNQFLLNGQKITKEQHKEFKDILYPVYEKQGKQQKDRGLY